MGIVHPMVLPCIQLHIQSYKITNFLLQLHIQSCGISKFLLQLLKQSCGINNFFNENNLMTMVGSNVFYFQEGSIKVMLLKGTTIICIRAMFLLSIKNLAFVNLLSIFVCFKAHFSIYPAKTSRMDNA